MINKPPLISIVTVVYNGVETLEETILSVLNQDYESIEYIIIDGGSTDGSIEIIQKYENDLAYWTSEPDQGIYHAMNKGISKCRGKLIGILNADDSYLSNAFSLVAKYYLKNQEADVFYGNMYYRNSRNKVRLLKSKYPLSLYNFYNMPIMHPTVFIKKISYNKYGNFNQSYSLIADVELILRFKINGASFTYMNDPISLMKSGGESETRLAESLKEFSEMLSHYDNLPTRTYFFFKMRVLRTKLYLWLKKSKFTSLILNKYVQFKDYFIK